MRQWFEDGVCDAAVEKRENEILDAILEMKRTGYQKPEGRDWRDAAIEWLKER